jgi:hypothetical protein
MQQVRAETSRKLEVTMTFWTLAGEVGVVMIIAFLLGNMLRKQLDGLRAIERLERLGAAARYADRQLRKMSA